ncbi:uncharacterized protein [Mytilus edulis]|uniref:uncharacterized protein n=1 Tax=Mytilus edulis TaxID=6550 RepID=UPI0039EE2865
MFSAMNMITLWKNFVTGQTTQGVDNTPQQVPGYLDTLIDVSMNTMEFIPEYTRYYFEKLSDTTSKANEYSSEYVKSYWNSAIAYNSLLTNMTKDYVEDMVNPVLQQTTDIAEYAYNNAVQPAIECTIDSAVAFISFSEYYLADFSKIQLLCILLLFFLFFGMQRNTMQTRKHKKDMKVYRSLLNQSIWIKDTTSDEMEEVTRRLKRNKRSRIPKTISRIENLYKILDNSFDKRTRLLDEIDYWCPVIMAQETKLRMANRARENTGENGSIGQIRDLGSHVDLNLLRIKENLDEMSAGVKREMSITANLYEE